MLALVWCDLRSACQQPSIHVSLAFQTQSVIVGHSYAQVENALCLTPRDFSWKTNQLFQQLRSRAHGPGKDYVIKPLLPLFMPLRFDKAIVLDHDLWIREGVLKQLALQFSFFNGFQMVGLAKEIMGQKLYPKMAFAPNGGVQLLMLEKMRLGMYERGVEELLLNNQTTFGYLGDQTLYSHLAETHKSWFFQLSCQFNRQLNIHFHQPASAYECPDGCAIVHGNHRSFKKTMKEAVRSNDTSALQKSIPIRLKAAFQNCW